MNLRALIVDDEQLARGLVREYLRAEPDIEVIGEAGNGFDAVKAIAALKPDLVFLDVQMPKLDGFEVLELVDSEVAVVFTTAHDQYAMKAFDAAAVDYLLKPFDQERFRVALAKTRKRLQERAPQSVLADLKAALVEPGRYATRVVVKDGVNIHIIPIRELESAEAQDDYVALVSGGKTYLKQQTIASLESVLNPEEFVRVHRSHIARLECIGKIEPYTKDTRLAVLKSGRRVPVSRAGYLRLKELMDKV